MLVQFSIWPMDKPHMSQDVADIAEILRSAQVRHEVGPMGTAIEGEWPEVMEAIQACHDSFRKSHRRVLTTITIDDDAERPLSIDEAKSKVAAAGGRTV